MFATLMLSLVLLDTQHCVKEQLVLDKETVKLQEMVKKHPTWYHKWSGLWQGKIHRQKQRVEKIQKNIITCKEKSLQNNK